MHLNRITGELGMMRTGITTRSYQILVIKRSHYRFK